MIKTVFKRIIDKEIPANILYEDELCLAFHDVMPAAPVHFLVIPKKEIPTFGDITDEDAPLLGHLMNVIRKLAKELKLEEGGYRVVNNCGAGACQSVFHLHFHVLSGRPFSWPPG